MSWFAKNYEKVALGGTAVVALALAWAGWNSVQSVDEDFASSPKGAGNNDPSVAQADLVAKAAASLGLDRTWNPADVDGRAVDLFTGIPLFVTRDAPDKALDPVSGESIHPPIPNKWWLENRIDPGFADSPARDPDGDGFSNLEEYLAKTDPNNNKSHPPLIAKLMYQKDESLMWVLRPGFRSGDSFTVKYEDNQGRANNAGAAAMVSPGDLFFVAGVMKERFKLLGSEVRKEMNQSLNAEMEVTIVRIEDQRPNKKGTIYEIPAGLSEARRNEYLQYDRTAVFSLEALGLNGTEFKVEENTSFALPPDAPAKNFLVKSVTPDEVVVEYKDAEGATQSVTILKGGLPQATP